MCIPTRTHLTYNNDKPWFTAKLRQLRQAKEDAYRKGDKVLYKQAKYTLEKEIREAKRNYSGKLRNRFSSSNSASVWKGMKDITSYKTPSPSILENQQLADDNWQFNIAGLKKHHHISCNPPLPTPALQISEDDVRQVFRKNKKKESTRPRRCVTSLPKNLCWPAGPIFTQIFNRSLKLCEVPSCFKCSTIIPVPRNPKLLDLMTTDLWL